MNNAKQYRFEVGGPFTVEEVRDRLTNSDVIEIDGYFYEERLFLPQAQASYAKSLIFSAEAQVACETTELIWASIASYYALFHLGLSLMLLLPGQLGCPLLRKLLKSWQGGSSDPTPVIRHGDIPGFLQRCEADGLDPKVRAQLEHARKLREHVNYAPRVVHSGLNIVFRTLVHAADETTEVARVLPVLLRETLLWATRATDWSWLRAVQVSSALEQFLTADDLLYCRWCSPKVLEAAWTLAATVPNPSELWKHR